MSPDEDSAPADEVAAAYDALAPDYADELEASPYHAHLAVPATRALVPPVDGDRILDAGCGRGQYAAWLRERGAAVVGLDASPGMLAAARERLADDGADGSGGDLLGLLQGDLAAPLPLAADAVDGVLSVLVLGYVEDWKPVFTEVARVLRPGGFVVVLVAHPADEFPLDEDESYFEVRRKVKDWDVEIPYYARPFRATVNPALEAGLRLDRVAEPEPTEGFREVWPERYETESQYPVFVGFRFTLPAAEQMPGSTRRRT